MPRKLSSGITSKPILNDKPKDGQGIYKFDRVGGTFYEYWREVEDPKTKQKDLKLVGSVNAKRLGENGFMAMKEFIDAGWNMTQTRPTGFDKMIEEQKKAFGVH